LTSPPTSIDNFSCITKNDKQNMFKHALIHSAAIALLCIRASLSFGIQKQCYDYDTVVIGAGASGMFAAGTCSSFGSKTLLIDKCDLSQLDDDDSDISSLHIGGDCTNAACVPSKAVRAVAQLANIQNKFVSSQTNFTQQSQGDHGKDYELDLSSIARKHSRDTIDKVRNREVPQRLAQTPNLDLIFSPQIYFEKPHVLNIYRPYLLNDTFAGFLDPKDSRKATINLPFSSTSSKKASIQVKAKKIIIATGASPIVPKIIEKSAHKAGLPLLTYRSLFQPDGEGIKSDFLWDLSVPKEEGKRKQVVIAGGGSTACEIAQSLARLSGDRLEISIVAPAILPAEDIAARATVRKMLKKDGIKIIHRRKVVDVSRIGQIPLVVLDDGSKFHADVLICAIGREPNVKNLSLDKGGISWSKTDGVLVNSKLQSISSKHVFACGDVASAISKADRRATHAGWTGYHAAQSATFPWFLIPKDSVHPFVPRVTFLDPEVASIGMTRAECVCKFGIKGFKYLKAQENGTDRADIDSIERSPNGFVELRVSHPHGKILGATVVSPAASEIINEIGVALSSDLKVTDIARSIHSYPSYGYLLHRVSLSLAMGSTSGLLDACGPFGRLLGWTWRNMAVPLQWGKRMRKSKRMRQWEGKGTELELDYHVSTKWQWELSSISYFEASKDSIFCNSVRRHIDNESSEVEMLEDFLRWLDSKPRR